MTEVLRFLGSMELMEGVIVIAPILFVGIVICLAALVGILWVVGRVADRIAELTGLKDRVLF